MGKTKKKFRGTANPDYARAIHAIRSSGAAGAHADKRTRRQRARNAALNAAIKDYTN